VKRKRRKLEDWLNEEEEEERGRSVKGWDIFMCFGGQRREKQGKFLPNHPFCAANLPIRHPSRQRRPLMTSFTKAGSLMARRSESSRRRRFSFVLQRKKKKKKEKKIHPISFLSFSVSQSQLAHFKKKFFREFSLFLLKIHPAFIPSCHDTIHHPSILSLSLPLTLIHTFLVSLSCACILFSLFLLRLSIARRLLSHEAP